MTERVPDFDRRLPDPGHEEPVCVECGGESGWVVVGYDSRCPLWEPCETCRGTGRPRCPDCEHGTVRTGPGRDDVDMCERCEGEGLL